MSNELLWLSLGSGPTKLPAPWQCHDRDVELTKPLPFADNSARFVLLEHVIEHLTHRDGLRLLVEVRRVLAPGGVLRLSFPDVCRVDQFCAGYLGFIRGLGQPGDTIDDAVRFIAAGSGHQSLWSAKPAAMVLRACRFARVGEQKYGLSESHELCGVDRHHETSTVHVATYETTILEGQKR